MSGSPGTPLGRWDVSCLASYLDVVTITVMIHDSAFPLGHTVFALLWPLSGNQEPWRMKEASRGASFILPAV